MGRGRVDFDRGMTRLSSYVRIYGHANPSTNEKWLTWRVGLWVSALRKKYRDRRLSAEQIARATDLGIRFTKPYRDKKPKPPTRAEYRTNQLLSQLDRLEHFYSQHGHINVPQTSGTNGWLNAGKWITRLRYLHRHGRLPSLVVQRAEQMGITWNPKKQRTHR